MPSLVKNNATGVLSANIASGDTSLTLQTGQGARFPSPTAPEFFYLTLIDASNNIEIVQVTARASDTLTIIRARQGTTARAYTAGDRAELRVTAENFLPAGYATYKSALGAVSAEDVLAVRADEKVFPITGYRIGETHSSLQLYTGANIATGMGVAANTSGSVIFAAYGIAGSDIRFQAATVGTDGTVTWGTAITLATTLVTNSDVQVQYNATGDYFVVFYSVASSTITARIFTYSGNAITSGNGTQSTAVIDDDVDQWGIVYHPGSNKHVVVYNSTTGAFPTVNYVDTSSGTPVWGTPVVIESVASGTTALMSAATVDPTTGNIVAAYEQGVNNRVVAIALSGTTFTIGTPVTISGVVALPGWLAVGVDTDRNRIIVVSTNQTAYEYSLSGTALTFQTSYSLGLSEQASSIRYNSTTKTLILGCRGSLEFFQWNGTSYVEVKGYTLLHGASNSEGIVVLTQNNKCVFMSQLDFLGCVNASDLRYSSVHVPGSNYYTENAVSVVGIAYSGASGVDDIVVAAVRAGGAIVSKTGVSAGQTYYPMFDGTINTNSYGALSDRIAYGAKTNKAVVA